MRRFSCQLIVATAFAASAGIASAQTAGPASPSCTTPDSLDFVGSARRSYSVLREDAGLPVGQPVNSTMIQRAIKNLLATGHFDDSETECAIVGGKAILRFKLVERPLLAFVDVAGVQRLSPGTIRDRVDLIIGRPVDPAQVVRAVSKIDSTYAANGYYLARVKVDTTIVNNEARLIFRVEEGQRFAVSGIFVDGNQKVSDKTIVGSMDTRPEGFFWWQKGEFDDNKFAGDLAERIPALYASRGYIDVQVTQDTMVVDRERGKALIKLRVNEGPQYHIGNFEVNGGKRFSAEEIARFYPFGRNNFSIGGLAKGVLLRSKTDETVFDQSVWDEATKAVNNAYASEGYLSARVEPVVERRYVGGDSVPTVDLRWDIVEGAPSIINRIEIKGNDVTSENCIRDQLFMIPGDVFSQQKFIQSYQNIAALQFFETPLPTPEYKPVDNDPNSQLLDITFNVKEKHTGNINFGASMGQTGVGGFVGFDQPNLGFTSRFPFLTTGKCKRGAVNWNFGQFINDFNLSLLDPRVRGSRVSSQVSLYHSMSRYIIQDLGRTVRTGGSLRFGFPIPNTVRTRFYLDYGGERVKYGATGLVSTINCPNCFRSSIGASLEHDTQGQSPFPIGGVRQSLQLQLNGGPLGGTATFQRAMGDVKSTATVAEFGGGALGQEPVRLTMSLRVRGGAVFGDPGPFFVSQSFALGGTQYGEQLRGYDEFSVTPFGYNPSAGRETAARTSFGNAFYTSSADLALRLNPQLALSVFYDVGNIWSKPTDFDPTRVFRGAGFGGAVVTPLGPLGVDLGYGFDRRDITGRKAPGWQVHFKFGQLF
jgi:outer membrane protein insertion porin family